MSWSGFDLDGVYVANWEGREPSQAEGEANGAQYIVPGDYSDAHYHDGDSVLERPTMPLSGLIGSDPIISFTDLYIPQNAILRIDNIPAGCEVFYPGGDMVVNDGFITWSSLEPGQFEMRLSLWPYNDVNLRLFVEEA